MSFEAASHHQAIELDRLSLEMCAAAGSGHPTSASSIGHIVTVLLFHTMRWSPDYPDYPTSDRLAVVLRPLEQAQGPPPPARVVLIEATSLTPQPLQQEALQALWLPAG